MIWVLVVVVVLGATTPEKQIQMSNNALLSTGYLAIMRGLGYLANYSTDLDLLLYWYNNSS